MAVLENASFQVVGDRRTGSFSIYSHHKIYPVIKNNKMAVSGKLISGKQFSFEVNLHKSTIPESHRLSKSRILQFSFKDAGLKIGWEVEFMFGVTQPIILWRLAISNFSGESVFT